MTNDQQMIDARRAVGAAIEKARKGKRITRAALSEQVNATRRLIYDIEVCRCYPVEKWGHFTMRVVSTINELCRVLSVQKPAEWVVFCQRLEQTPSLIPTGYQRHKPLTRQGERQLIKAPLPSPDESEDDDDETSPAAAAPPPRIFPHKAVEMVALLLSDYLVTAPEAAAILRRIGARA